MLEGRKARKGFGYQMLSFWESRAWEVRFESCKIAQLQRTAKTIVLPSVADLNVKNELVPIVANL